MRSRNIKPGFFDNEDLGSADPLLQILFAGLWCMADREGRLEDRPMKIKATIFPYRSLEIHGYLTELSRLKFITRYQVDGVSYIWINTFAEHQNPHHTEKASKIPKFSGFEAEKDFNGEFTVNPRLDNGEYPADSGFLIPDSLIPDSLIQVDSVLQTETGKPQNLISKENDLRPENPTEPHYPTSTPEQKPNQAVSVQIPRVNETNPGKQKQSKPKFTPPTPEEAKEHAQSIGLPERESQKFYDYFASNGWLVGKARTPMQSWHAALRNWKRNWEDNGGPNRAKPPYTHPPPQKPLISTNVNDWLSKPKQQTTA
jgi:hypothetical protein